MADLLKQIKEFPQKPDFGDSDLLLIQGQGTTYNVQGRAVKKYAEDSAKPQVELAKKEAQAAAAAADQAEDAIQHPAIPDPNTGNWLVWDQVSESYQQTEPPVRAEGQDFEIRGYYPTLEALEAAVPEPGKGYAYGVGTEAPYDIYVWDLVHGVWVNNGPMTASGDMLKSVYDPQRKATDVFAYAERVGLPAGGTTGQIPVKASDETRDVSWQNLSEIGVTSFNGRKGGIVPAYGDYSVNQISGAAPKAYPVFTGSISLNRKTDSAAAVYSIAVGSSPEASGSLGAAAFGNNTKASGDYSIATGSRTVASGSAAAAFGYESQAQGDYSLTAGHSTIASGNGAAAFGNDSQAQGNYSFVAGYDGPKAIGTGSVALGCGTIALDSGELAVGQYNVRKTDSSSSLFGDYFVVGKGYGKEDRYRQNAFRVSNQGVFGTSAFNTSGADYAEMFEWVDGNQKEVDRVGRFVTLEGAKIRLAGPEDDYILGIVSGSPSVVGDVYDDEWKAKFLTDIFGRPIWEDVEVPDVTEEREIPVQVVLDDGSTATETRRETVVIIPAHTERRQKLNPDYDNTQLPYIPRSARPEWDAVGMMGKLVAVDDGTCQANGWAAVGEGGVATASDERTAYRVMERLDEGHVRILILR